MKDESMNYYMPLAPSDQAEMLKVLGYTSIDDLYAAVPPEVLLDELNLPEGISELELMQNVSGLAAKNTVFPSIFRGAGAYHRYIPALVKTVISKEEFLTSYTPYQAEISQGVLQSIFEYQSMICELTGLDASNASLYDGASAAAEAVLMCQERKRSRVVISATVNPQWIEVVETYCASRSIEVRVVPAKEGTTDIEAFTAALGKDAACGLFQQINYFGILEETEELVAAIKASGAKAIVGAEPISLGILQSPGELGADICVAEGQPLGLPLSFGGPYLGIIACVEKLVRRLPGRIVGQTQDAQGNRAFVLTLQAREQHIRREKASSNVCSNQALCALAAGVYLASMGAKGLETAAQNSYSKAQYALDAICSIEGFERAYSAPCFNEFVTTCSYDVRQLDAYLAKLGILGGLPVAVDTQSGLVSSARKEAPGKAEGETPEEALGKAAGEEPNPNALLWCTTEMNTKAQIDELIEALNCFAAEVG